jgi:hypothetical protein
LYHYWCEKHPEDDDFLDHIPELLEKKYLKNVYYCHECNGTLDANDLDGDNEISVFDLDIVLANRN